MHHTDYLRSFLVHEVDTSEFDVQSFPTTKDSQELKLKGMSSFQLWLESVLQNENQDYSREHEKDAFYEMYKESEHYDASNNKGGKPKFYQYVKNVFKEHFHEIRMRSGGSGTGRLRKITLPTLDVGRHLFAESVFEPGWSWNDSEPDAAADIGTLKSVNCCG